MNKGIAGVFIVLLVGSSGGCVLSASSFTTTSGSGVPGEVFREVRDGQTDRAWLIEHLGEPTASQDRGQGLEDLIYEVSSRVEEHFNVLLLVSLDSSIEIVEQWTFELKDNVLQRHHRNTIRRASKDLNE